MGLIYLLTKFRPKVICFVMEAVVLECYDDPGYVKIIL